MSTGQGAKGLRDAAGKAWREPRHADPTKAELRLGAAARRFAAAAISVEDHDGPRSGSEYAIKVQSWRRAYEQLVATARAIPGEGEGE